ncbi:MAG TPA: HtaA domain-containing protein [Gaiellales bacterium]|nr:HtaA domain-containing protein [Gaiellales bacterium]
MIGGLNWGLVGIAGLGSRPPAGARLSPPHLTAGNRYMKGIHMKIRLTRVAAALTAALLVVPGAATAATGSSDVVHLNGVRTTLMTDPATTGVLVKNGILPLPVGPATVAPRFGSDGLSLRYGFPITGGRVNATTLTGFVNHSGGLRFVNVATGRTLTLTEFRIRISDHPGLTAEVNRAASVRVRILNLDLARAHVVEHPPLVKVSNVKAALTQTAASALNDALGVSFFSKGITLGAAQVRAHIG